MRRSVLGRYCLYGALFATVSWFVFIYLKREHLTLHDVDKKVEKLDKEYKKLKKNIDSQEARMGGAAADAAEKQAALHAIVKN